MNNFKALYTPAEVAELVFDNKISAGCIRVHAVQGKIPCTRFGSKIFIPGKWLKEQLEYGFGNSDAADKALMNVN